MGVSQVPILLNFLKIYFYFMRISLLPYVSALCVPRVLGGLKMAPDSLELELQWIVSHHMGAGNLILC